MVVPLDDPGGLPVPKMTRSWDSGLLRRPSTCQGNSMTIASAPGWRLVGDQANAASPCHQPDPIRRAPYTLLQIAPLR
jgi:hypothetical protein